LSVAISVIACGGSPPPKVEADPYGARIAQCIDAPRGVSDAASDNMIALPSGLAVLGSTRPERAQAQRDYGPGGERLFMDEASARRAHVHAFRMDRTPVTNKAYAELLGACGVIAPDFEHVTEARWAELARVSGSRMPYATVTRFLWNDIVPPAGREQHPVVLVSQDEAAFYCAWRGGRLPSEDEWERAARGQTGSIYPWGERFDPFRVNVALHGAGDTLPVGSRAIGNSPEGFTDLGGHVLEWTSTPARGRKGHAVVKGNGWDGRGGYGRGAALRALPVEQRDVTLGFRCAQ
jgi:formylglycine-generating enzyme required for sulfatase activity